MTKGKNIILSCLRDRFAGHVAQQVKILKLDPHTPKNQMWGVQAWNSSTWEIEGEVGGSEG